MALEMTVRGNKSNGREKNHGKSSDYGHQRSVYKSRPQKRKEQLQHCAMLDHLLIINNAKNIARRIVLENIVNNAISRCYNWLARIPSKLVVVTELLR